MGAPDRLLGVHDTSSHYTFQYECPGSGLPPISIHVNPSDFIWSSGQLAFQHGEPSVLYEPIMKIQVQKGIITGFVKILFGKKDFIDFALHRAARLFAPNLSRQRLMALLLAS